MAVCRLYDDQTNLPLAGVLKERLDIVSECHQYKFSASQFYEVFMKQTFCRHLAFRT